MHYFGTQLDSAGHHFHTLEGDFMGLPKLSFPKGDGIPMSRWNEFPFDPENMPKCKPGESLQNGDVRYYLENGYRICAIKGSCKDKRSGSKSIFFTEEKLLFWELVIKILSIPIAKKIIHQMPFPIKWGFEKEYMEKIELLMAQ